MELTLTGASLLSDKGGSVSRRRGGLVPSSSVNKASVIESSLKIEDVDIKDSKRRESCHDDHDTHSESHSHAHSHHESCSHDHHHHNHQRQLATIESVPIDQLLSNPTALFQAILVTIQAGRFSTFQYLCNAVLNYESSYGTMNAWVEKEDRNTLNQNNLPVSALARRNEDGFYLCHWACKRVDDYRFLEYLLAIPSVNVHVPSTDSVGMYPMHWAATVGSISLIHRILKHMSRCNNNTSNVNVDSLNILSADNDPVNCRDKTGCTPLLIAAQYGHADLVAFLIKRGANPFAVDDSKDTALHWAGYKGSVPVCSLLLHLIGMEGYLDLSDSFGQTPLHLASLRGNLEVVQYLLEEAERFTEKNQEVFTSASSTSTSDEESRQSILFRIINHQDRDGKTPLGLAIKKDKLACELVLREYIEKYQPTQRSTISLIQRTISLFLSVKNWKIWMGLSADSSKNIASIQFVFWFVVANLIAGTAMEFLIFSPIPMMSSYPGRLQDFSVLNNCAVFTFILTWISLILVHRTNPGVIGSDSSKNKLETSVLCRENARIEHEMDRLSKILQADYNSTLESFAVEEGSNMNDDNLLCHSCRIAKPLRSKHCRIKNRCILLFDHYCPFVGNTIGKYNYKYFFLFLVSFTVNEAFFIHTWIIHVYRADHLEFWIFASSFYLSLFIIMTTGLLIYHSNLVLVNLTTNEHQNVSKYRYLRKDGRFHNPFNKGILHNIFSRFFPNGDSYISPNSDTLTGDDTETLVDNAV